MNMPVYGTQQRPSLSKVLAWEFEPAWRRSRKVLTILAGDGANRSLLLGTVMGVRLFGAATVAAAVGNTGDGSLSGVTLGDAAKTGTYTVTCVEAAADGGRFQVVDPDGLRLADAQVGAAYDQPQIGFALADGAADFVVGDAFTITVAAGDGKAVALDPTGTDGTQIADCILVEDVTAPDGVDAVAEAIWRDAVFGDRHLIWPDGITADEKAAALARLAVHRVDTIAQT